MEAKMILVQLLHNIMFAKTKTMVPILTKNGYAITSYSKELNLIILFVYFEDIIQFKLVFRYKVIVILPEEFFCILTCHSK